MELRFIGQGYNLGANTSVAQVLIDSFANEEFHTFKCMVAFASHSGVSGLTAHINNSRTHIATTRVIIGIDQGATSKEALERLLEWDADVYVFYSAQINIFHPKIYIFEGDNAVSIVIGSNNLTEMGLVKNIESSVLINFNKDEIEADNLLDQINAYFETIFVGENPNLKILTAELIQQLVEKGIVPNEVTRRAKFVKENVPDAEPGPEGSVTHIRDLFPGIGLQGLPEDFKPQRRQRPVAEGEIGNDAVAAQESIATSEAPIAVPVPLAAAPAPVNSWNFADGNNVLIAEIGGSRRWKQISFAKANFETFFMLPTAEGQSGQINLKYLETNGNLQNDIEIATSGSKGSSNYNIEPLVVRTSTVPYNTVNRPIIFFIKIDATHFIYHFETNGTPLYNQLNTALGVRNGNFLRRRITTVADLRAACPALTI